MLAEQEITLFTDSKGNRYYTTKEAMKELGISRSTFDKRIAEEGIKHLRRANDIRFYYRIEDIQRLKQKALEVWEEDNKVAEEPESYNARGRGV